MSATQPENNPTNTPKTIDEVLALYMPIHPDHAKDIKAIKAALSAMVAEAVNEETELAFSDKIPVFNSLEEYVEHVVKVRKQLRKEINERLAKMGFVVKEEE